jgi:hypothetical protein
MRKSIGRAERPILLKLRQFSYCEKLTPSWDHSERLDFKLAPKHDGAKAPVMIVDISRFDSTPLIWPYMNSYTLSVITLGYNDLEKSIGMPY